jgi:hypothetical protein
MNHANIITLFEKLDTGLSAPTVLYLYGSAAFILLGEEDRTSLDIDVAGPYSSVDMGDMRRVAEAVGCPVNPSAETDQDHIEWVGPLRLCLPPPDPDQDLVLWTGHRLTVKTGSIPALVASKLIRYDETDRADIQFLYQQNRFAGDDVADAVNRLPLPFRNDSVVRDNLKNLRVDMTLWQVTP